MFLWILLFVKHKVSLIRKTSLEDQKKREKEVIATHGAFSRTERNGFQPHLPLFFHLLLYLLFFFHYFFLSNSSYICGIMLRDLDLLPLLSPFIDPRA